MNAKISMFVICVEAIISLLLYHLYDCTLKIYGIIDPLPFDKIPLINIAALGIPCMLLEIC